MLGILPKRLAEYDLRRQKWERLVGWYLTFQMRNQAAKMRFSVEEEAVLPAKGNRRASVPTSGAAPLTFTPQHSLKMKTVLQNSHVR